MTSFPYISTKICLTPTAIILTFIVSFTFNFGISILDLNSIASILLAIAIFEILSYSSTIKSISAPSIPLIIDLFVLFCTNKFTGIRIFVS